MEQLFGPELCTGCFQPKAGAHKDDCPYASHALGLSEAETLEWMRNSEKVRLRDIGVIASVLVEQLDAHGLDDMGFDCVEVAKAIIKAQTEAGLGTFVLDEVREVVRRSYRRGVERGLSGD